MGTNLAANIGSRLWLVLSNVIFLPLYIKILGIENYAVISFTLIVTGILMILDLGLSVTIAREMARGDVPNDEKYTTLRALEKVYALLLIACMISGQLFSSQIATHFIKDTPINRDLIGFCLKLITCEAGFQICFRFYISAIMGLDRQIEANMFNVGWGLARNGLVLLVLYISPTLPVFFIWQLACTAFVLILAWWRLRSTLMPWRPVSPQPFIDWAALKRVRGFASGVFLIAIVAVINTQLDRIVLSGLLSLEYLGYYNIAVAIGTGMLAIVSPFLASIQPRLTMLFSQQAGEDASELYLRVATVVSILIFPLMAVIGLNAELVVVTWTGDSAVAEKSAILVPWIVIAYTALSMQQMPYGVAMANGYTRYNNILGVLSLMVSIPGYWIAVGRFGAAGAAGLFLIIQVAALFALMILVDRRFLKVGGIRTCVQLLLAPAAIAGVLAVLCSVILSPPEHSRLLGLIYLGFVYLVSFAGTALVVAATFGLRWHRSDWERSN